MLLIYLLQLLISIESTIDSVGHKDLQHHTVVAGCTRMNIWYYCTNLNNTTIFRMLAKTLAFKLHSFLTLQLVRIHSFLFLASVKTKYYYWQTIRGRRKLSDSHDHDVNEITN